MITFYERSAERIRHAALSEVNRMLDGAIIKLYDAGPKLLAELPLEKGLFSSISGGRLNAKLSTRSTKATAGGKAKKFILNHPDYGDVLTGSAGSENSDLVLNASDIQEGAIISMVEFSMSMSV